MNDLDQFASEHPNCQLCGTTRNLQVDHIMGRRGRDKDNPANLLRLCLTCHQEIHGNVGLRIWLKVEHGELSSWEAIEKLRELRIQKNGRRDIGDHPEEKHYAMRKENGYTP